MIPAKNPRLIMTGCTIRGGLTRALFSSVTGERWFAETKHPLERGQRSDPWKWDTPPRVINFGRIYPTYIPSIMTVAIREGAEYLKEVDLQKLGARLFAGAPPADITLREILVCEMLRKNLHPSLCAYRGVVVNEQGLVSSLVFERYDCTLIQLVRGHQQFDAEECFRTVESGVKHLHALGYIHYDLKPENIFYDMRSKRFVLGDFDAVQKIGVRLHLKHGAMGFIPEYTRTDLARVECDWYGLEVLKFWLEKKGNGKARRFDMLPSTTEILEEVTKVMQERYAQN
ncbi:hypothetical protein HBI25_067950 [Parastagonospora nodorum]|nr:hypothetical protein HBH52_121170 [Parastagonospora nodorum]KAH4000614.1 hypothetical protein HBI10_100400 [Parastagonospora nodorum]KAH4026669.1 hypothetical protein HBI13_065210 [Parastagonospora nodorum]KAH4036735.1 hypothetical protein HBI09_076720 [Parastagonospora nodorum]KAH4051859.1 hypothetical protein HBH49_108900 [Parastagonospora nodorum]